MDSSSQQQLIQVLSPSRHCAEDKLVITEHLSGIGQIHCLLCGDTLMGSVAILWPNMFIKPPFRLWVLTDSITDNTER